ncbi:MAG: DNA mismatch repair protein MutS, partial [Crocinitomicaceae bacterium]
QVLEQGKNNFLCAIHFGKDEHGIAFLDVSTGEFLVAQGTKEYIDKLISGFDPSEIVFQKNKTKDFQTHFGDHYHTFRLDDWAFTEEFAKESLNKHFGTKTLKGFGIENLSQAIIAAGAVFYYLSENQHQRLGHITSISRIEEEKYVWLDRFTVRNLELVYSTNENAKTLADIVDKTYTPMGGRLMKRWMVLPLKDEKPINERLDVVDFLKKNEEIAFELGQRLREIGDLERLISKVAVGKVNPKEVMHLRRTLLQIKPIKILLQQEKIVSLVKMMDQLNPCDTLIDLIEKTLTDEPAGQIGKGAVIRSGCNSELDELREISFNGKDYLEQLQERESQRTGIPSLKISFNNVFGYYIEVRNTHKDKVPEDWIRKQTLVNAERYITEELKEYETKILGAEEKILAIETKLFQDLVFNMADYIQPIQHNALVIARLDCLFSFAQVALENNYNRPQINDGYVLDIK